MSSFTRFLKLFASIGACALVVLGGVLIAPALLEWNASAPAATGHAVAPLSDSFAESGSVATACDDDTTCTSGAIANVASGDTLVVEVTEFTTSHGHPSAVEELANGQYTALTLLGNTSCVTGSGHGVTAFYGLADAAAQASVTFVVNYTTASYYTIHGLDVEGAAASPFEAPGPGVCSPMAGGTTGTANVTTTVADDLVILGVEVRTSTTFAASGGDTLVNEASTTGADLDSGAMLDEIDPSTGLISLSSTFTSAEWSAIAIALKGSPLQSGSVSPSTAAIDVGQSIDVQTTAATGGSAPITYQWYAPTSTTTCSSGAQIADATGQSYATPALPVGTYYYCVWATDSSTPTAQVVYSNVATITVNPALSVTITPNASTIDSGQTVELTAHPAGGTGADSYDWYSGTACTGPVLGSAQVYTTPALTSNAAYCVVATDSAYSPATANATANVTVDTSPLSVTVTPSAPSVDSGQTVALTAHPAGGTGADTFAWFSGSTCSGAVLATTQVYTTPAMTATQPYCVEATDGASTPATATANVTVSVSASPLAVTITPHAPTIDSGQTVELTAVPSGGTGADTYAWYAGTSCTGTVLATTQAYTTEELLTNASYCVAATDSAYVPVTAHANATVTVTAKSTVPTSSGSGAASPTSILPIVGAVLAVLAAALLLGLLWARRGRKVTFTELGLPEETHWSVTLDGAARESAGPSVLFRASKGEHEYVVKTVTGYAASPPSGIVKVDKDAVDVRITFTGDTK